MRTFWQRKEVSRRGILALCLAFALTILLLPNAFGIIQDATADSPTVTVAAVGVDGTYVELGLSIQSPGSRFRSVGAVVTYDPALLTPVKWIQDVPETLPVQGAATDPRTDWNTAATTLDTKGPDQLSGKTALAYEKEETPNAGYLYLSAEAPKLLDSWEQLLPATVPLTDGDGAQVTTDNGFPVILPEAESLDTPVEQSVVVRFKLNSADANAMANALASIDLATGDVAVGSPIFDESGVAYFHNDKGESLPVNARILRAEAGTTYFTGGTGGGTDISNLIPVIFYDWDGVTMLGSRMVDKTATQAEIQAVADSFTGTIMKGGYDPATYDPAVSNYDADYPLNAKQGYSFGKWVDMAPVDGNGYEAYTGYGRGISISSASTSVEIAEPNGFAMPAGEVSGLMLQAAYQSNADLEYFADFSAPADHYYTVTDVAYLQFKATTNYQITVRVQRGHTADEQWVPVPRVRKLGIRIGLKVKGAGGTVYMRQELENQDDLTASFAVNDQVEAVEVEVIDLCDDVLTGGTSDWTSSTIPRSNTLRLSPENTEEKFGFIKSAGIGFFNEQCRIAELTGVTVAQVRSGQGISAAAGNYNTAELNYTSVANSTVIPVQRLRNAIANILDMYLSLEERRDLTWDEMQQAIKHGTKWDSTAGGWEDGFTGTYIE